MDFLIDIRVKSFKIVKVYVCYAKLESIGSAKEDIFVCLHFALVSPSLSNWVDNSWLYWLQQFETEYV